MLLAQFSRYRVRPLPRGHARVVPRGQSHGRTATLCFAKDRRLLQNPVDADSNRVWALFETQGAAVQKWWGATVLKETGGYGDQRKYDVVYDDGSRATILANTLFAAPPPGVPIKLQTKPEGRQAPEAAQRLARGPRWKNAAKGSRAAPRGPRDAGSRGGPRQCGGRGAVGRGRRLEGAARHLAPRRRHGRQGGPRRRGGRGQARRAAAAGAQAARRVRGVRVAAVCTDLPPPSGGRGTASWASAAGSWVPASAAAIRWRESRTTTSRCRRPFPATTTSPARTTRRART